MKEVKISTERLDISIQAIKELCMKKDSNVTEIEYRVYNLWNSLFNLDSFNDADKNSFITKDKRKADARLQDFDPKNCFVWKKFCEKFGSSLSQTELISIAEVISSNIGVKVDREAKRRKEILIKWFDENSEKIIPFIDFLRIERSEDEKNA
ncbi:hypothetical protein M9Y10_011661 [Tritrichomonas musculus]|uniref:Death domain-containing protein n=1 Tax=Tritrichomonas musculus TaxID=1915356 RepID=A0ABR2GKR5_9EUKA